MNLTADDGFNVMKHVRQVDFLLLQLNFSAFNPAHVQNIVDQGKQVVAGGQNFRQIIPDLFRILHIGKGQRGKADDRIHGGADIVGHVGKEGALGLIGRFRGNHCVLGCQPQPVQLLVILLLDLHHLVAALDSDEADDSQHHQGSHD